jgi:transposase-like protein
MRASMEATMGTKRPKGKLSEPPVRAAEESELPERWSAQRKTELVLRVLRGEGLEGLDAVSRDRQVPAHELEAWKRTFLEAGGWGLKSRGEPRIVAVW